MSAEIGEPFGTLNGGEIGCIKSHRKVLLNSKAELVLVLEDDFELCEDFDRKLNECLNDLPNDWNALWLGGRVRGESISYGLNVKIKGISGTYGYIVKRSYINTLLKALNGLKLADAAMSSVFKNVYKTKENLVKHRNGFSIIQSKIVEYNDLA